MKISSVKVHRKNESQAASQSDALTIVGYVQDHHGIDGYKGYYRFTKNIEFGEYAFIDEKKYCYLLENSDGVILKLKANQEDKPSVANASDLSKDKINFSQPVEYAKRAKRVLNYVEKNGISGCTLKESDFADFKWLEVKVEEPANTVKMVGKAYKKVEYFAYAYLKAIPIQKGWMVFTTNAVYMHRDGELPRANDGSRDVLRSEYNIISDKELQSFLLWSANKALKKFDTKSVYFNRKRELCDIPPYFMKYGMDETNQGIWLEKLGLDCVRDESYPEDSPLWFSSELNEFCCAIWDELYRDVYDNASIEKRRVFARGSNSCYIMTERKGQWQLSMGYNDCFRSGYFSVFVEYKKKVNNTQFEHGKVALRFNYSVLEHDRVKCIDVKDVARIKYKVTGSFIRNMLARILLGEFDIAWLKNKYLRELFEDYNIVIGDYNLSDQKNLLLGNCEMDKDLRFIYDNSYTF